MSADDRARWERLDLSDPRRALEELATVPSLRERAEAALRELDSAREVYWGMIGPSDGSGEILAAAYEDARDEARQLLAEVLL